MTQRQHPGLRAVSGGLDALTHLGNTCHRGPRGRPDRDVHQDARFLIDVPTTAAEMEAVGEAAVVVLVDKVSIGVLGLEDQLRAGGRGTVAELIALTDWDAYGHRSGNPKCQDCMVHSGFEATAVDQTFSSLKSLLAVARLMFGGAKPTELGPDDLGPSEIPPPHIDVALGELTMNHSSDAQPETAHEASHAGERSA